MKHVRRSPLFCVAAAWLWVSGWCGAHAAEPRTTGQLLVDLARDRGLRVRGEQTAADVQAIRTLLEAAARIEPDLAEAHAWLYELAVLTGDEQAAGQALAGLLKAHPTHAGAFERWLAAGLRAQQTLERRQAWLEEVAAVKRPPRLRAAVCVARGRLALECLNFASAREQALAALGLDAASLDAAWLALESLEADAPAEARLQAVLRVVQRSPMSVDLSAQVGTLLHTYGFVESAGVFFDHVTDICQREATRAELPGTVLLSLARNLHARGQTAAAIERVQQAISADPFIAAEAGWWLHWLNEQLETGAGEEIREQLAHRFAGIREPQEWPVNEVAQAAWFYVTLESQPERALMLAQVAAQRRPQDAFVQRVLGWALAANLKAEVALETLRPIADRDPYAAYRCAVLLREAGDEEGARVVLKELRPWPLTGSAAQLLASIGEFTETQPTTQSTAESVEQHARRLYPEMARVLATFDQRVLNFHRKPEHYLKLDVTLPDRSLEVGQPWWVEFRLTNIAPFPITLGPEGMVNPVFLLSFGLEGDRQRDYPNLMTLTLDAERGLLPGESARLRRTVDVGPLRQVDRQTPQHLQRVAMRVVLDPVQRWDGQWQASAGGQEAGPVYFNRVPAATTSETLGKLFRELAGGEGLARLRAVEVLAELASEQQRAARQRLEYRPTPLPLERLEAAIVHALQSGDWELRARALEALQVMGLTRASFDAARENVKHEHWLVRLMATRLLARRGKAFATEAREIAQHDPDELVRAWAQSFAQRWESPATQPAATSKTR